MAILRRVITASSVRLRARREHLCLEQRSASMIPPIALRPMGHPRPVDEPCDCMPNRMRDRVFVSYSHNDEEWLDKFRAVLAPDIRNERVDYWDDRELQPGDPWYTRILDGINTARAAVLLVSPNFLASRFIMEEELPRILKAVDDGLTVLWIPLFGTFYGPDAPPALKPLADLQAYTPTSRPLALLDADSVSKTLLDLCKRIQRLVNPARVPRNLPFTSLGNLFKGRDEDLTKLDVQLFKEGAAAIVQPETVTGMGGIGKTRLALEYAWRHADDFNAFLFVSANTPEDLDTNFAQLCEPDTLDLPEYNLGKQADQHAAVLRWLQQNKGWLLILDNVDTPEAVAAVKNLVARLHGGQVIITSRVTGAKWGNTVRQVSLEVMPLNDAVALLLESTEGLRPSRSDDADQARLLAQQLGCLPLALTHASAYIREQYQSIAEYAAEFERNLAKVLAYHDHEAIEYETEAYKKDADPKKKAMIKTVATTFFMSFERLGTVEKTILRAASFLAPEPIPIAMFESSPGATKALVTLWCEETKEQPEEKPVRDAVSQLARFSLVTRSEGAFSVHRMVQAILRNKVSGQTFPKWLEGTRAVLFRYVPYDGEDPKTWQVWDKLRAHAEILVATCLADSRVEPHMPLMDALSALYYGKGSYSQSLSLEESILPIAQRIYAPNSGALAHRFISLGESLRQLGRYAEAERAFRKSLAIREVSDGPKSLRVAEDLNYVAIAVEDQGRRDEAESLQRQALEIFEAQQDKADKGSFAKTLSNLGNLMLYKERLDEAEALKKRALRFAEEGFGPDHPKTLIAVSGLAWVMAEKGDASAAEPLFKRAKEGCEKSLGLEHPITLQRLTDYAYCLQELGQFAQAEELRRHALAISEQSIGPDRPDVANNLSGLASLLEHTNRLSEAESLHHRALAVREKSLGADHPKVAETLNNLAALLQRTNRLDKAEPLFRRALAIWEKSLGADHPNVASGLSNLASLLQATNRLKEAGPLYRRALAIREKTLPADHSKIIDSLEFLAGLLEATGRFDEAIPLRQRALEAQERRLGSEHPKIATCLDKLANLLKDTNRLGEAEPLYRRALAIREKALVPDDPDIFKSIEALAGLLEATGRFDEAIPLRQRALEAQERRLGSEHPDTLRAWNNYGVELRKHGYAAQAEPIVRRVAAMTAKILGDTHALTIHRRNNLVLTLIMLGNLEEGRQILAASWRFNSPPYANTTSRIAFLRLLIALLETRPSTPFIGQLKTLLAGPELTVAPDVAVPWDIAYFVEYLRPKLQPASAEFFTAIIAAMNNRTMLPDLDRFPEWRNQAPIPLDTPWPST